MSNARCLTAAVLMAAVIRVLVRSAYGGGQLEGGLLFLSLACWVVAGVLIYLGAILLMGLPEGVKTAWAARRQR